MEERAHGLWLVLLTFLIAYLLAIVPLPEWAVDYRPQWVLMVLIYWLMALPYRVNMGAAWFAGLMMDVLQGSLLGLNAMSFTLIAYLTLSLHRRLRMFSYLQQSALVLALTGLHMILVYWIRVATSQSSPTGLFFLLGAAASAFLWPWIFVVLRHLRRAFDVH